MPKRETIIKRLAELGDSPDKIAKSLKRRHITGFKWSSTRCPISTYLHKKFPEIAGDHIGVSPLSIIVGDKMIIRAAKDMVNKRAVFGFIRDFDHGKYPELSTHYVKTTY